MLITVELPRGCSPTCPACSPTNTSLQPYASQVRQLSQLSLELTLTLTLTLALTLTLCQETLSGLEQLKRELDSGALTLSPKP